MNHLLFKVNTSITHAKLKQALSRCKTVQVEGGGLASVTFPKGVNLVKLVTNTRGKPVRKASRLDLDQRGEQRDGSEENTLNKIPNKLNVSGMIERTEIIIQQKRVQTLKISLLVSVHPGKGIIMGVMDRTTQLKGDGNVIRRKER